MMANTKFNRQAGVGALLGLGSIALSWLFPESIAPVVYQWLAWGVTGITLIVGIFALIGALCTTRGELPVINIKELLLVTLYIGLHYFTMNNFGYNYLLITYIVSMTIVVLALLLSIFRKGGLK